MSVANFGDARLPARFWNKVHPEPNTGCWLWMAYIDLGGYARYGEGKRCSIAHTVSFRVLVGSYPAGFDLDHLCRVRCCVNPAHLEPVTHLENARRGLAGCNMSIKTHCPSGHAYAGDNLYVHRGSRQCRACGRARAKARYVKVERKVAA